MHFKLSIVLELQCSHQSAHQMPTKDTILVSANSTPVKLREGCAFTVITNRDMSFTFNATLYLGQPMPFTPVNRALLFFSTYHSDKKLTVGENCLRELAEP